VIVSFLVNMLFLKIKSGVFIIRLFFPIGISGILGKSGGGGKVVFVAEAGQGDG
jgi:hypothetical protein